MKVITALWQGVRSLWPPGARQQDATEAPGPYLSKYRILGLAFAGSLGLFFGLGVGATVVDAWGQSCSSTFPATGQQGSYPASTFNSAISVNDDGVVQAGGQLSYTDTGPTIIDNNTGLEWEKLGQPDSLNLGIGSPHDWRTEYYWTCPVAGCVAGILRSGTKSS